MLIPYIIFLNFLQYHRTICALLCPTPLNNCKGFEPSVRQSQGVTSRLHTGSEAKPQHLVPSGQNFDGGVVTIRISDRTDTSDFRSGSLINSYQRAINAPDGRRFGISYQERRRSSAMAKESVLTTTKTFTSPPTTWSGEGLNA
ncbi:hypothetical protein PoB_001491900 [Plakobranchus ocellatus]|uniref:Uncharacterized protein n=1 Tax=Plakobranchus ocellatus TaxID=259542 RepID=A0AAV3Z1X9_9GAST|nr:hypothetical protein PoB_001491900 [Plakobranchus ocellatus]